MSEPPDPAALTPERIVAELDRHVVGQREAKRAVAVAIRNRWRRLQLDEGLRRDVVPRNLLLMGPTGVGKTEIARRIADLIGAPFTKVEATKFTEVGYVGRDVESIVRDLLESAIAQVKERERRRVAARAAERAEARVLEALVREWKPGDPALDPLGLDAPRPGAGPVAHDMGAVRVRLRERLRAGALDEREVQVELTEGAGQPLADIFSGASFAQTGVDLKGLMERLHPPRQRPRRLRVREALRAIAAEESEALLDAERVAQEAVRLVEDQGIVFLDEIDKIAGRSAGQGPDVSREGVQRDLLPLVEGTTVATRHGPVRTDHILFIGAGAFHLSKPSDLLPELQGRMPIRVRLAALGEADFVRILTEPQNSLTRQAEALLATEGVHLEFSPDGVAALARAAAQANETLEDIGARRLSTVLERVLEEVSFDAPGRRGDRVRVDAPFVQARLGDLLGDQDLGRYIL